MDPSRRWCLVLPVKRLDVAKTRLGPPYAEHRRSLALAFALDTTVAALACPTVACVQVVTDDARGRRRAGRGRVPSSRATTRTRGSTRPWRTAPRWRRGRIPERPWGRWQQTSPLCDPASSPSLLATASAHPRSFVRDAQGTGTTLLLARDPDDLRPMFGAGSADRHARSGAVEIPAARLPSVRRDVDTAADLDAALALGVGSRTSRVLDGLGSRSQAG